MRGQGAGKGGGNTLRENVREQGGGEVGGNERGIAYKTPRLSRLNARVTRIKRKAGEAQKKSGGKQSGRKSDAFCPKKTICIYRMKK